MKRVQKLLTLSFVLLAAACSQHPSTIERLGGDAIGIFSNRPIKQDEFIAILKLKSPALLDPSERMNNQVQVDQEAAQKIEEEQNQLIADLKTLSPEIRVLFRYRMVLNGIAIVAPISLQEELKKHAHIAYMEQESNFGRPVTFEPQPGAVSNAVSLKDHNSVKFIGAEEAHQAGIQGQGMKIGIIDTGIDYTHAMLGGAGTEEAYKAIDPSKPTPDFPNAKVVGGIDLAGTQYDTSSGDSRRHTPVPDDNPLDEAGHGSHVAGTVAGIGDSVETYSGVAPGASLYAIKVFGKEGSTGDAVVIAGLEYAADPNRDGNTSDKMDVVNMSLGSSYGSPHILYGEAIRNLTNGGTVVVASAGNEGNHDYIVGAPSVVDEAISVAASVDDASQNWQFNTVKFTSSVAEHLSEAIEGPISKPIAEAGPVSGKLVAAGNAKDDFSPELAAAIKGNVALIDRGIVPFSEKMKKAFEAGAIGMVVVNNQPGAPISMGGDGHWDIPAVMIPQELGETLKEEMKSGDVVIRFQNSEKVEKPELIDTLTSFSSKGPRSIDGLLKPEISAPGNNVISAEMGKGSKGVQMSGTSMAGPHITGVMALLKQAHPDLTPAELKSILMGHAKSISDEKKQIYPLSRQGAGRVQVPSSLDAKVVADASAISLGELNVESQNAFNRSIRLRNISKEALSLHLGLEAGAGLSLDNPQDLTLAPGESKTLALRLRLDVSKIQSPTAEMDGLLKLAQNGEEIHRIPVLAMVKKISQIKATELKVAATSQASSAGSVAKLTLKNSGVQDGVALPFNLLGMDGRQQNPDHDEFMTRACDLQAVGYRILDKTVGDQKIKVLQIGIKVYEAMTSWNVCELSVLIDSNGDQIPDQELAAVQLGNVKGLFTPANEQDFASVLLDAGKARALRADYEQKAAAGPVNGKKPEENYADAALDLLPLTPFNHSTVMVVEADVTKLARRPEGPLAVKVATIFNDASAVEMDDFLGNQAKHWQKISLEEQSQSFMHLPESLPLKAGQSSSVEFDKGQGQGQLLMLYPDNRTVISDTETDDQLQILQPKFGN